MKAKKLLLSIFASLCVGFSAFVITSCGEHVHEWVEIERTNATCTEDGKITYLCPECEEIKDVVIEDAKGHVEVIDAAVEPTCTKTGLTEGKHCSTCNEVLVTQEEVDALGHNYAAVVTESTCTEQGYTTHTCESCNDSYVDSYVDALGHNYNNYVCVDCEFHYYTEGLTFHLGTNDSYSVYTYKGTDTDVIIPLVYNGKLVTSIGGWAFEMCSSLTSITIPEGITEIGQSTFYGCSSLESIEIPDSVTSVGNSAFAYCSSLTSITIPDSVTSIGYKAFSGCTSLTSVIIPVSVTEIYSKAFEGCSSLTSITIGNNVTRIDNHSFEGCISLTSITIPNSVTSIGYGAFEGCSSLTSITIPDSVTSIDYEAFAGCKSLTDVYYTGTKEQWNAIFIDSWNNDLIDATIHYNYKG